ncbi:MAG: radical SAM protein [Candidatus Wallbacteria bacterium]|nr:radical SAM protein [Candidatus Wallbacteria bacterium]
MKNDLRPCLAPFRQPMLRVDGSLTVCNYDLTLNLKLGNLNQDGFEELWYGPAVTKLRLSQITGTGLPEKCLKCRPDHFLPRNQALKFLHILKREELAWPFLRRIEEPLKVLLVNPRVSEKAPYKMTVTLGLAYLAARIRESYQVEIINMPQQGLGEDEVVTYANEHNFNVVGITGMTYQGNCGLKLAKLLKGADYSRKIIFGGPFATLACGDILKEPAVDAVALGEGEETLSEFLSEIEKPQPDLSRVKGLAFRGSLGEVIVNEQRELINLDSLPEPARDLEPTHCLIPDDRAFSADGKGEISVMAMFSRGCPGNCIFCASPRFWRRKVRYRMLDNIIAEIKGIIRDFGVRNIVIDDDAFTVNRKLVMEFCARVIEEKLEIRWRCNTKVTMVDEEMFRWMKKAGCVKVSYGVESGNDNILAIIGKEFRVDDVRRALALNQLTGLTGTMLMIVGHPYETEETALDSLRLVQELKPEGGWDFQIMQPHPGTALREKFAKETGRLLTDDWDEYFSDNITYLPEAFTPETFLELCRKVTGRPVKYAGDDYNPQKSYLARNRYYIEIPPQQWEYGYFDEWPLYYWDGDDTCKEGYTHTLGKNHGEINYSFACPIPVEAVTAIRIRVRLSSQHDREKSLVYLYFNQTLAGNKLVAEKSLCGEEYVFEINPGTVRIDPLKNELKFKLFPESQDFGISIFYRPLRRGGTEAETPIIVEFDLLEGFEKSESQPLKKKPGIFKPIPLLILDTANFCDLRCIMCPIGFEADKREKRIMNFSLLEKIISELISYDFKLADAILPFWNGEPLIYPYFIDMLQYLHRSRKRSFNCLILHTNAQRLYPEISEFMVRSGLFGSVTFSLDASSPETYAKIRVGGELGTAEGNIREFLKMRKLHSSFLPTVNLQFLVMTENHREAASFITRWNEFFRSLGLPEPALVYDDFVPPKSDSIFIKRTTAAKFSDQPGYDELHRRTLIDLKLIEEKVQKPVTNDECLPAAAGTEAPVRRPCVGLFENLGVRWDGQVSACCRDFGAANAIGSVWDKSLLDLWESEELKQQRLCHLNSQFDRLPLCKNCPNQPNHRLSGDEIQKYLKYIS